MLIGNASAQVPTAAFNGTPISGIAPLTVTFTDQSTGIPTGWTWYFGDENYTAPWTQQTPNAGWSSRRSHSSVVMPDGSIVLMGGRAGESTFRNDVWRSMDNGATWVRVNATPGWSARYSHSSVVMPDGSIILMGGMTGVLMNDVWRSPDNGTTWTEITPSAEWSARAHHSTVVLPDGSIVLMGGTESGAYMNDVWRSTDNGTTWTEMTLSAGWSPRCAHSSVAMPDGSIVLMGGVDASGNRNDVWRSTDNGTTWTGMTPGAGWSARQALSSVAMPDGSIVLMGGSLSVGSFENDVWQSWDNGATWTEIPNAGWSARCYHTAVAMPDGSIVLVGGGSNVSDKNDVWRFQSAGSSAQNPSHTYTRQGIYQVTLQVFNEDGYNSTRKTGYITVNGPPSLAPVTNFTGTPTSGTAPLTVTFTDSSTNSPTSWNWSFGDGSTSATRNPVHTYTNAGTYNVSLNATNAGGSNTKTSTGYITVDTRPPAPPAPVANFTGTLTSGTVPLTVSLTDSSSNSPTGWAWYFGDENYAEPWTQMTASAGWSGRLGQTSVPMPDGSIVLMGGSHTNDVWWSTDEGATWAQVNASAGWSGRSGHSSVVTPDGSIVLMGGSGYGTGAKNDVWRSTDEGATWTQMTANAGWPIRSSHCSVEMPDGSIVLMGGEGSGTFGMNDVWRSTDEGATWTQMAANAGWSARSDQACVAMADGSILLIGGIDNSGNYKNDVWRSTDDGATWTQMTGNASWSGRWGHSSVVMPDGSIVLMGGIHYIDYKNDVWRSTDHGATWTEINRSAGWSARGTFNSVVIPDGSIVLMGGMSSGGTSVAYDVWRFLPSGSSEQNPVHTYTTPGIYQVSLQAYNAGGYNSTQKASYITVYQGIDEGSDSDGDTPSPVTPTPTTTTSGTTITEMVNVGGGSAVTRAGITGTNLGKNLVITAFPRNSLPSDIAVPNTTIFQYISLTTSTIPGVVNRTTFEFSVPQSWLTEHGFTAGDIVMMHYDNGQWQTLDTAFVSQNSGNVFYRATTPGFSYFAIAYQKGGTDMGGVTPVATTVPTQVAVLKAPVPENTPPVEIPREKTQVVPPAPVTNPSGGIPMTTIIVGTTGAIATLVGTVLIRRWWIRKQNPTLFRKHDRY